MRGTIKKVLATKNFGFINMEGVEYFFHRDDYLGHWDDLVTDFDNGGPNIPVTFEAASSPKGPRARNVSRTDFPNQAV